MEKAFLRFGLLASCLFSFMMFISYANEPSGLASEAVSALPQIVRAPDINKQFDWAGEIVPFTSDARERLDRELLSNSYYHSATIQAIKLANRHFPIIERALIEEGVPADFKYLAVAESGLREVCSYANACGYWQFLKGTGKEYGLEINDEVDERYHIEKSSKAAAKYIKWLKNKFGTWTDAAAAYNTGPGNYASNLRTQRGTSFYNMNLNDETSRYVFRLIAIKEIMANPEQFGYFVYPEELYPALDDYNEVIIDKTVSNWGDFAHQHHTTYRELKRYNPWLRDEKLTVIKNEYRIKVPRS
jgi:hypothetical protein